MLSGCILCFVQLNARAGIRCILIVLQLLQHGRFFFGGGVGFFFFFFFFCYQVKDRSIQSPSPNTGSFETNTDPCKLESISLHAFSVTVIVIKCI